MSLKEFHQNDKVCMYLKKQVIFFKPAQINANGQ